MNLELQWSTLVKLSAQSLSFRYSKASMMSNKILAPILLKKLQEFKIVIIWVLLPSQLLLTKESCPSKVKDSFEIENKIRIILTAFNHH